MTPGRQLPNGVNETDSNGDVPSPDANIQQNGNGVNSKEQANFEKAVQKKLPAFCAGSLRTIIKS